MRSPPNIGGHTITLERRYKAVFISRSVDYSTLDHFDILWKLGEAAADASIWVQRDRRWVGALHTESFAGNPLERVTKALKLVTLIGEGNLNRHGRRTAF